MIYLDYHATTPTDPRVVEAMLPYFLESFGNPASSIHAAGKSAHDAVESARKRVAKLIGAAAREIVFTAGATESNNLVIQGLARGNTTNRKRIIISSIEHKSVLAPAKSLQEQGYEIVVLPVDANGRIEVGSLNAVVNDETLLVSIQAANNEIGTIQTLRDLVEVTHESGALFHTDASQAIGKIAADVNEWDVDLLSFSAHKLYGPKGVGVLYMRGGPYALPIKPIILGGEQENNLRSGTLNVPGIVGLGEACHICLESMEGENQRTAYLRDRLEENILGRVPDTRRNGDIALRLPNNSSLTFPGIDAEALIINAPELALSTGSACTTGAPEPSYVLTAIGLSRAEAYNTVRVGIGRFTTKAEIDRAGDLIVAAVERLQALRVTT